MIKKGKILGFNSTNSQNLFNIKESLSRPASKSSSKVINNDTSYNNESNDECFDEDDQLAFISRKIRNIWNKRSGSDWKGSKKSHREKRTKIEALSQAMNARNQDTSSKNAQILISQITRKGASNQRTRRY